MKKEICSSCEEEFEEELKTCETCGKKMCKECTVTYFRSNEQCFKCDWKTPLNYDILDESEATDE